MSRAELAEYIDSLHKQGIQTAYYQVEYHLKAATPLAAFIFVLLGAPLIIRVRAPQKMPTAAACVGLVVIYYVLSAASASAGRAHILSPAYAAWLPTVFFLFMGAIAFWWANNE